MKGVISLGTFPFAGPFTKIDEGEAARIVNDFLDAGGRRIDTAPTYGFGAVEELLGRILAKRKRDEFEIVTSCGFIRSGDEFKVSGRFEDVRIDVEESLARLGLDFIDIYYSHIPDPETPLGDTSHALNQLRTEGLVGKVGLSNINISQLVAYQLGGKIDFIQNRFSFLNRAISKDFAEYAQSQNIGISVYQAIERGLLTDRGPSIDRDDDLRCRKPEFEGEPMNLLRALIEKYMKPVCDNFRLSLKKAAILWALNSPGITAVQVGATRAADIAGLPFNDAPAPEFYAEMEQAYENIALAVAQKGYITISRLMGLDSYDIRSGSASGR
jgi:methylglyoxal reductase